MMRLVLIALLSMVLAGCGTTTHQRDREWSPTGIQTKEVDRKNEEIVFEQHRALEGVVVEGRGNFTHDNAVVARNTALNLAINDLAKSAGEVLSEEDSTVYNEQVRMIIRTRARNLVRGYQVAFEHYDPVTRTAEVIVRQDVERIAAEMMRYME